ncbi:MAG: NUDIX domain-containing protein [Candidatus Bathyarchaeia archaeon]
MGLNLAAISSLFLPISFSYQEMKESLEIKDICPNYLDNFGAHVLSSQLLGSCHLKRILQFSRRQAEPRCSAGCIVFTGKGKAIRFLMLRREKSAVWDFPKGKAKDKDKSSRETALREVAEETGLTIKILQGFNCVSHYSDLDPVSDWIYPFLYDGDVRLFIAKALNTEVHLQMSAEHDLYAWLPFQEAMERLTLQDSRDALAEAHEFLKPMPPIF